MLCKERLILYLQIMARTVQYGESCPRKLVKKFICVRITDPMILPSGEDARRFIKVYVSILVF